LVSRILTPAEEDALVRFDPTGRGPHVESLFIKLNLPDARALWLKLTFLRRSFGAKEAVVEAWAMAFNLGAAGDNGPHVALKKTWPAAEAEIAPNCLYVRVGSVILGQGRAEGELFDDVTGERVRWDLNFTIEHEGFRHLPYEWMYEGGVPKSKANSPQIDSRFTGSVCINGVTTRVEDAPGMLGHNWGTQHAEDWTWVHCNQWTGVEGVVFEGVTSKVKMGPMTTPRLTVLHLRLPGERLTLNTLWQLVRSKSRPDGLRWDFMGQRGDRRIEGSFSAPAERFVGVDYHDPDGRVAHCLNTKIADGTIALYGRGSKGWEQLLAVTCDRSAALEIGSRDDTFDVPIRIR
jgi:hypothetical protein